MFSCFLSIFTISVMMHLAGGSRTSDAAHSEVMAKLVDIQSQMQLVSLRTEERLAALEASVKSFAEKIEALESHQEHLESGEPRQNSCDAVMERLNATVGECALREGQMDGLILDLSGLSSRMKAMEGQQVLRADFKKLVELVSSSKGDIEYIRAQVKSRSDVSTTETAVTDEVECPEPYERVGPDCLFLDEDKHVTWDKSRALCKDTAAGAGGRGDIAVPADLDALAKFMSKFPSDYYWLGATDEEDEDEWKWLTGEKVDSAFVWANDEPDHARDQNYMCIKNKGAELEFHDCFNTVDSPPVCQYFSN